MPRRTIRLTVAIDEQINSAAKLRGYSSPSAFLRAAIKKELGERVEGSGPSAEQIVASIRDIRQDIRRLERAQQALFALLDSLAKAFLTCMPEPRGAALEIAVIQKRVFTAPKGERNGSPPPPPSAVAGPCYPARVRLR